MMSILANILADKRLSPRREPGPSAPAGRQVRLKAVYVDFWSATKMSFLLAAAMGLFGVIVTFIVWVILNQSGAFQQVGQLLGSVTGSQGTNSLHQALGVAPVMTFAVVVAVLNTVVFTVLGTVAAGFFNLSVRRAGGLLLGFRSQ